MDQLIVFKMRGQLEKILIVALLKFVKTHYFQRVNASAKS